MNINKLARKIVETVLDEIGVDCKTEPTDAQIITIFFNDKEDTVLEVERILTDCYNGEENIPTEFNH